MLMFFACALGEFCFSMYPLWFVNNRPEDKTRRPAHLQ